MENEAGMLKHNTDEILTEDNGGHKIRSGRQIVDRSKIGQAPREAGSNEKLPNQYTGHTYKNKDEKFRLDGHKLLYHMDRVKQWMDGERVGPIQIDMGLTKFCNVACVYCIGVTQGGMQKGQMIEPEALLRFISDCGRLDVRSIAFIGDGEPTLNPALYDAVELAKNVKVDIGIATNGLLLDMSRAHDVLKNCTFVRFNLSAGDEEGFKRIHQSSRSNFHLLTEKIKELVALKKRHNYSCTIGLQMVLIPENFDQVIKLGELGKELGVDYLQIKQCSDTEYGELGINPEDYRKAKDTLTAVEKLADDDYFVSVKWNKINIFDETDVYRHGYRKYDICHGTPLLGQISGNGKVYPCGPFFGKERFYIGDINKQSYFDLVHSDRYWEVQKDISENVDVHCDCTVGCRQDYVNKFLFDLKNPPQHINFI